MSTESSEVLSQARIIEASLLTAIESCGTQAIATALDIDEAKYRVYPSRENLGRQKLIGERGARPGASRYFMRKTCRHIADDRLNAIIYFADLGFKSLKEKNK